MTAEYALFGHCIVSPVELPALAAAGDALDGAPRIHLTIDNSFVPGPEFKGTASKPHAYHSHRGNLGFARQPDGRFALYINDETGQCGQVDHDPAAGTIVMREEGPTNLLEVTSQLVSPSVPLMLRSTLRYFPLHASVLAAGDCAIAICGRSGAGKTTLARFMHGRSHEIIADDLASIDQERGMVHHGAQFVRLDGIEGQEQALSLASQRSARLPKSIISTAEASFWKDPRPLPLRAIILLSELQEGVQLRLERLAAPRAALALARNMSGEMFLPTSEMLQEGFTAATHTATRIPVLTLHRPPGLEYLEETANIISQAVMAEA